MNRSGWQKTWVRILTTVLTVTVIVFIFCFSMEGAEQSDKTSGIIAMPVIHAVHPDYDQLPEPKQKEIYDSTQHVIRKIAHFSEYALLGLSLRLCLESWAGHRRRRERGFAALSWGAGVLYAVGDEFHQKLIDGRAGQFMDVLIDAGGVLAGVMAGALIIRLSLKDQRRG